MTIGMLNNFHPLQHAHKHKMNYGNSMTNSVSNNFNSNMNFSGVFDGFNQMNNLVGQNTSQQNPMQMIMDMMKQIMQMLGLGGNDQQNNNNDNTATAFASANGNTAFAQATGDGATASASAGPNGAQASASTGGDKQQLADELQKRWDAGDRSVGDQIHQLTAEGYKQSDGQELRDPYEVNIDGDKYVFVKDGNNNGKIDKEGEILGYNDTKDNLFSGMKELDGNKDGKVDKTEMDKAGVKLAKVGEDGKVKLDQTKDVNSVDLSSFNKNNNFNGAGEAGSFNVNLADGRNTQGKEIFESSKKIQQLLTA